MSLETFDDSEIVNDKITTDNSTKMAITTIYTRPDYIYMIETKCIGKGINKNINNSTYLSTATFTKALFRYENDLGLKHVWSETTGYCDYGCNVIIDIIDNKVIIYVQGDNNHTIKWKAITTINKI